MSSEHIGKTCPFCQTPVKPGVAVTVCPSCGMPHHAECWRENGGCTTFGCPRRPVARMAPAPRTALPSPAPPPAVESLLDHLPRLRFLLLAILALAIVAQVGIVGLKMAYVWEVTPFDTWYRHGDMERLLWSNTLALIVTAFLTLILSAWPIASAPFREDDVEIVLTPMERRP